MDKVIQNTRIKENSFLLAVKTSAKKAAKAGRFYLLKPEHSAYFLPRPISVFSFEEDAPESKIRFLIDIRGGGTAELSSLKEGDKIRLTGPLGNGFSVAAKERPSDGVSIMSAPLTTPANGSKKIVLISGGSGFAPLVFFAKEVSAAKIPFDFFAGFSAGTAEDANEI